MYMGTEKEEQGKVYVYALNQVMGTVGLVEIQEDLSFRFGFNIECTSNFHSLCKKKQRIFQSLFTPTDLSVSKRTLKILIKYFKPLNIFLLRSVKCFLTEYIG